MGGGKERERERKTAKSEFMIRQIFCTTVQLQGRDFFRVFFVFGMMIEIGYDFGDGFLNG